MKTTSTTHPLGALAAATALFLVPASAGSYGPAQHSDCVKQVKVKDHKIKVKVDGGKAKIKEKANGKQKVKVKGRNGDAAAAIAADLDERRHAPPQYGYTK